VRDLYASLQPVETYRGFHWSRRFASRRFPARDERQRASSTTALAVQMLARHQLYFREEKKRSIRTLILLLFTTVILAACAAPAPTAAPATATDTKIPVISTRMQIPTRTRVPTRTPFPTVAVISLEPGQHPYSFRSSSDVEVQYLLYLPEDFDPDRRWPLILFLHGSGGRGTNIELVRAQPLPQGLEYETTLPFVVVSPQLPYGNWSDYLEPMDELLAHLQSTLPVDPAGLYLTGFSLGGFGVWEYVLRYPDRFAAIAPIAGGYVRRSQEVPEDLCKLKHLPIWVFHGGRDTSVEPYQSQILVDALQACGGEVTYTLYPDADHLATSINAYSDPALYKWFLAHTK